jgi:chromosome segregation ATPase
MKNDINAIIREIKVLEKQQKEAELSLSKYEGQLEQEMKRLKNDYGIDSLDDAEKELDKLQVRLERIDDLAFTKFQTLKEKYDLIS